MHGKTLCSPGLIASKLFEKGFFALDASQKINCNLICSKFQKLIDDRKINYPRTSLSNIEILRTGDLEHYHQTLNDQENRISDELYRAGEYEWRSSVAHVTVKDPLVEIPDVLPFILDEETQEIAVQYLGGKPKIGYVKIKKSYANDLNVRTYNHVYHIDDNAGKILKTLTYLKDVSPRIGGGFHYVANSKARDFGPDRVYFTDEEVQQFFPREDIVEFSGPAGLTMFADTVGIHKEGRAEDRDRWIMIVNYVLEEEYGGTRPRQIMTKEAHEALNARQRAMCEFIDVQN